MMVNETNPKRQRIKEGDVVAIPLSDGRFAFGREFEHGLGIYDFISNTKDDFPIGINRFLFITGVYRDVLSSGIWPKVTTDQRIEKNSPKKLTGFTIDLISGSYEQYDYESGKSKRASLEECVGLERVSAWDSDHIVKRIEDTIKKEKSSFLDEQGWVPDILELDAKGNIVKRIKFDDWKLF